MRLGFCLRFATLHCQFGSKVPFAKFELLFRNPARHGKTVGSSETRYPSAGLDCCCGQSFAKRCSRAFDAGKQLGKIDLIKYT